MPPNPPVRPPSLVTHPGYLAAQVAKSATRLLGEELADHGVRPHHMAVLATLEDLGPQCQQDLCDRLDLDKSHMVAFVDDLEGMGHLSRTRDPDDRRRHRLELAPSGSALLVELRTAQRRYEASLFGDLDDDERAQLTALLARVVESADDRRLNPAPSGGTA